MTYSTTQTPEYDEVSSLPDASDIDTMANETIASESRNGLFLPNTDDTSDSEYFDGNSNIMTSVYQELSDGPSFSNLDYSEYHESSSSTATPIRQEVTDQSRLSGAGEVDMSGNLESDSNALTPGNYHVIDEYSFLSDAPDARDMETSRTFETAPRVSTPNQLQIYNQSFLPDASEVSETTINMESPQASTSGSRSLLQETSDVENPGRLTESYVRREAVEHNNLFFRKDDGSVLAIRINSGMGPELLRVLRGLSQQSSPLTQLSALPFAVAPSTTLDDDLTNETQKLSLTTDGYIPAPSSAAVARRKAPTSTNASAPILGASTALSRISSPESSTGIIISDTWMDQIFSSTDGKPYDRDRIRIHNVNKDILNGIPSKHKLDLLVRHGAVTVGDKLCVTYHSSGDPVIIEGEVLPTSTSSNLCVRIAPARATFDGILRAIQGPKDLISGMNKEYAARHDHAVLGGWKEVRLASSTGQDFGTLYDVRQAYQVWADQKAKWVVRTGRAAV